jgi:hypothetical protein
MGLSRWSFLLVLIALGWSERPARRAGTGNPAAEPEASRAALGSRIGTAVRADTTVWTDTARRGDTTFYSSGRVLTTLAVLLDSHQVSIPAVRLGIANGPFHLSLDSLCAQDRLGYSATFRFAVSSGASLISDLAQAKACNGRVIVGASRNRMKGIADGGLNVAAGRAEIARWPWDRIGPYIADGTILGFYAGDDVSADEWGKQFSLPTRMAMWDSIYGEFRLRAPGVPTMIRAKPTDLAVWGYRGTNITTAWAQYRGPYRDKDPRAWVAAQVASAKAQKLGLIIGHNLLDGGCGPAKLAGGQPNTACLPNLPGTGTLGTTRDAASVRRYQSSPAEYLYYKMVFLTEPYACASIDWQWSPAWSASPSAGRTAEQIARARAFHSQDEVRSAARALGELARKRAPASCIQSGERD